MANILGAILKINPKAEVTVDGDDINTCEITWNNGTTPIPKADIEAKIAELPTEEEEITADPAIIAASPIATSANSAWTNQRTEVSGSYDLTWFAT